jgi:hypothetical protein
MWKIMYNVYSKSSAHEKVNEADGEEEKIEKAAFGILLNLMQELENP